MEGILKISSNRGRYVVVSRFNENFEGPELSSGCYLEVFLGDQWVVGSVEHFPNVYAVEDRGRKSSGYVFISKGDDICGLCAGMHVKTEHNAREDEWYTEY